MIDKTIELKIDTCLEETAPPVTLKIKGNDESVIFWAEMVDPTWAGFQSARHSITAETDPYDAAAIVITACIKAWSLDVPVSVDALKTLNPLVQEALATQANLITEVKQAQAKNSKPASVSNGTQPSKPVPARVKRKSASTQGRSRSGRSA